MCLSLAATNINAECPSGNAPTIRVVADLTNKLLERIIRAQRKRLGIQARTLTAQLPDNE